MKTGSRRFWFILTVLIIFRHHFYFPMKQKFCQDRANIVRFAQGSCPALPKYYASRILFHLSIGEAYLMQEVCQQILPSRYIKEVRLVPKLKC